MRHHANTRPPLHAKRADAAHPSCTLSVRRASHSPQAHTLAAIHIVCFVRLGLLAQVGDVQTAAVATGIANTLGNKGGVALRCSVGTSSLLFINSHLTAHQHAVAQRNADFHRIDTQLPLHPPGRVGLSSAAGTAVSERGFDAVVWLGDLNYRIDANRAVVDALLAPADASARADPTWRGEEAHWEEKRAVLLANDQLRRQMAEGGAFVGYNEGEIRFRPTYKFDSKDPAVYDQSEKRRVPAYTDRVLYRGTGVELQRYTSCESLLTSDHHPVTAEFCLSYKPLPSSARSNSASLPARTSQTSAVCLVM